MLLAGLGTVDQIQSILDRVWQHVFILGTFSLITLTKYLGVCYTIKQNIQKLHCFLEKLTQLARILLDRQSRRSWQISTLKTSSKIFAQEDEKRPSSELPHRKLNIQTKTTDLYFNARVASVKWKNGRISIHMCTYMYLPEEIFAKPKSKENN